MLKVNTMQPSLQGHPGYSQFFDLVIEVWQSEDIIPLRFADVIFKIVVAANANQISHLLYAYLFVHNVPP
jgi:hypothetical protein